MERILLKEKNRLLAMSFFESKLYQEGYRNVCGVDEAGRGPLAGPVVAAAVVLPKNFLLKGLNDSKKVEKKRRKELFKQIVEDKKIHYATGIVDTSEIDKINILQATLLAMKIAIENLILPPDYLLIDGNISPKVPYPNQTLVKGDQLSLSIAAASIIAKCMRDEIMEKYHTLWPNYGFNSHKGYGTKKHLEAIQTFGPCSIHRKSFEPVKSLKYE